MYALKEIREKLCRELDELAQKQEVGVGDLDILYKLTTTIKNIDKIEMYGQYSRDDGYSRTGEAPIIAGTVIEEDTAEVIPPR